MTYLYGTTCQPSKSNRSPVSTLGEDIAALNQVMLQTIQCTRQTSYASLLNMRYTLFIKRRET